MGRRQNSVQNPMGPRLQPAAADVQDASTRSYGPGILWETSCLATGWAGA